MAGKFQIKKSSDNQFYFNLKAGNGEIILTSEMYRAKNNAENGIASVKTNAPIDSRYDKKTAVNGQFCFNLKAANGEIIGKSEMYTTSSARDSGIGSVKQNAPGAAIEDLT